MRAAVIAGAAPWLCVAFFATVPSAAQAVPSDFSLTSIVEPSERKFDFQFDSAKAREGTLASAALGPALFGKVRSTGRDVNGYNEAWLLGTDTNRPRNMLRLQLEYEV